MDKTDFHWRFAAFVREFYRFEVLLPPPSDG